MDRRTKPVLRAGAMAFAAATGLLALASTGQTPTGFVPAAFGGPLGLFDGPADASMADVLTIGDGPSDASELADLLKTVGPSPLPTGPAQPAPAASDPTITGSLSAMPELLPDGTASAPATKQSLGLKPVLDSKGRVDCSKAVSCETDPATNITTVTYSDGVVAIVQKINDLTLVAYKTVGDVISSSIDALLPDSIPALPAAALPPKPVKTPDPAPVVKAVVPTAPELTVKAPDVTVKAPSVSAGPVAPSAPAAAPELSASDIRPQLTITTPPEDYDTPKTGGSGQTPKLPAGTLDTVKDAVGSVVDAVTGAVGKAIGPGAAVEKPAADETDDADKTGGN